MTKYKCKLLPFERIDCLSLQDAKQKAGWSITAFDLPKSWEKTQGEGVVIAVLDTGCDLDHPDLVNNLLPGINFVNPKLPPIDDNGHGAHCTGIICAENNEIGMVGVAPKAKVRPIKVLDKNGNGNMLHVAEGIRWAIDQKVDFISMSLGCPVPVQQVRKAIQLAAKAGIITFVAAGNAGLTKEIFYPANYPECISIGAIDKDFNRADFSNTGHNLDFMAPGVDIFSTVPDNWYATLSGTSMACPFAVGVAALMLAHKGRSALNSADAFRAAFKEHTISPKTSKFYEGFGIIDPQKFLDATR